jgi:hypothetical protein
VCPFYCFSAYHPLLLPPPPPPRGASGLSRSGRYLAPTLALAGSASSDPRPVSARTRNSS